jgi:hypothetical protein
MEVDAVDFLKGLPQAEDAIAKQYKTGRVKRVAGLMWAASQMTRRTRPARSSGSGLVNQPASLANGATSIALDDFTVSEPAS